MGPSTERNGRTSFNELIHLQSSNYQSQYSESIQAQSPTSSAPLFKALETLADNGQRRLTTEFDHKQIMLLLDAADHRLISIVYALNPNVERIDLVNMYRQRIADRSEAIEEVAILCERVSLRRFSRAFDHLVDQSIDELRIRLSSPLLDKD